MILTRTATATNQSRTNEFFRTGTLQRQEGAAPDSRTLQLSFSSEEPYDRWFGPEILDHGAGAVDLTRLNEMGCLLFNHNRDRVIGKILRAWVEGSKGYAEVEFDTDPDSETIFQKVQSGTLKGVSVGYRIDSYEEVSQGKTSADGRFVGPCTIARKWCPFEVSIVAVPADGTVGVGRQAEWQPATPGTTAQTGGNNMTPRETREAKRNRLRELLQGAEGRALTPEEAAEQTALLTEIDELTRQIETAEGATQTPPEPAGGNRGAEPAPAAPQGIEDQIARSLAAERERVREITALCRHFELDPAEHIASGATLEQVRSAVLNNLMQGGAPVSAGVHITDTGEDEFRRDASDGILLRGRVNVENPSAGARQLSNMSLRDLAIECLEREGVSGVRRMSSDDIFQSVFSRQYFNPTAAFPSILDNAIEKAYIEGHRTAPVTFDRWTRKGTLRDFKTHDNYYIAGPVGEFLEVPEGAELKNDIPLDAKRPTRKLKTYGKQFTLTRQAFINDDIGLVTSIPSRYAAAARKTINTQVYRILLDDKANIYDGRPLFCDEHSNLLEEGTKVTQEAMQAMMMGLSEQKDEFGQPTIIRPAFLILPDGYQFDMYTLFWSPTINTAGNTQAVNPLFAYRDSIEAVTDPTINALCGGAGNVMPWFLLGNQSDTDFIEVDYLNGQEIPTIRRMETPGQLGFVWDVYLDWGISVMDFRGGVKNPGVKIDNPLKKKV